MLQFINKHYGIVLVNYGNTLLKPKIIYNLKIIKKFTFPRENMYSFRLCSMSRIVSELLTLLITIIELFQQLNFIKYMGSSSKSRVELTSM